MNPSASLGNRTSLTSLKSSVCPSHLLFPNRGDTRQPEFPITHSLAFLLFSHIYIISKEYGIQFCLVLKFTYAKLQCICFSPTCLFCSLYNIYFKTIFRVVLGSQQNLEGGTEIFHTCLPHYQHPLPDWYICYT